MNLHTKTYYSVITLTYITQNKSDVLLRSACALCYIGSMSHKTNINPAGDSGLLEETEHKLKKPRRYRVLLHNDDYTTMDFVMMVLMNIFHHNETEAMRIMLKVHHEGIGVAGIYSFEVAETKANKTMELARRDDFPLQCSVEPE